MNTKNSIVINKPIDEVFAYVSDVANMPRWVSGVRKARLVSKKLKAGAKFTTEYVDGWRSARIDFSIVEFDPPRRFVTKSERGPFSFPFRGTFEFRAVDDGTEVTTDIETGGESLGNRLADLLFGPWVHRGFQRRLQAELQALRAGVTANK
jgi:uncharacterized protein YndB with AHSA1/START domain